MKKILGMMVIVFAIYGSALADIPRPEPAKTPKKAKGVSTDMSIKLDANATEARLLIPKSQIKALRAELEQIDDASDNAASVEPTNRSSHLQTLASGLFLSLSLVFGGIWFVRSGSAVKKGKSLVIVAGVAAIASAATLVYGNIGPPPEARSITGKIFSESIHRNGFGSGRIKLQTTDNNRVELIVPNGNRANGDE